MRRCYILNVIFLLFFIATAFHAAAQPQLPDIAGVAEKGIVVLSWNSQYNGIKSIAVQRSADSLLNFKTIGYVKKLDKGVQAYIDGHPVPGISFYKLMIIFNSGLNWAGNFCRVIVPGESIAAAATLPGNDSLQKFIITESPARDKPAAKESAAHLTITFDPDSAANAAGKPAVPRKKLVVTFDDPTEKPATFIKSKLVFSDPVTSHIRMELPEDLNEVKYSIQFFDARGGFVTEVPKLNTRKLLLDKRNFPGKGLYKFVVRKEGVEFESGYVSVY